MDSFSLASLLALRPQAGMTPGLSRASCPRLAEGYSFVSQEVRAPQRQVEAQYQVFCSELRLSTGDMVYLGRKEAVQLKAGKSDVE